MGTALYRVTMRRVGKKPAYAVKLVAEQSPESAVSCAQQWVVWSNDTGRGKRVKYNRYQVDTQIAPGEWQLLAEGTLDDAKAQQPQERADPSDPIMDRRTLIGQQGATTRAGRKRSGRTARPQTRLAEAVAKMRAQR